MDQALQGVIPIVATPFNEDHSVDLGSLQRLTGHLLAQGAHGLAVFGNAGEGYTLLPEERRSILETVVKDVDGRAPVCAGIGETGTRLGVEACREAEGLGASVLMVLPPYYLKPDADGLIDFYGSISDAVSIPIMIQDAPLLTGVSLPPGFLARLEQEIDRVHYAKIEAPPTAPKITQVQQATGGRLTLLGGLNGQFMIEEITRGSRGVMPASDMTSVYVDIWNALESNEVSGAWRRFTHALPLIRFELQPGLGVSAVKHNLVERGIINTAQVRSPTRSLDSQGLAELAQLRELVFQDVELPA